MPSDAKAACFGAAFASAARPGPEFSQPIQVADIDRIDQIYILLIQQVEGFGHDKRADLLQCSVDRRGEVRTEVARFFAARHLLLGGNVVEKFVFLDWAAGGEAINQAVMLSSVSFAGTTLLSQWSKLSARGVSVTRIRTISTRKKNCPCRNGTYDKSQHHGRRSA
ncbi:MAG: hypothetical protein ACYCOR_14680 [Acidobacteriaceae bacterium]